jgi:hypothetical protein
MPPPIPLHDRLLGRPVPSSKPKRTKALSVASSSATALPRPTAKPKRTTSLPTMITSVELRQEMLNVAAGGEIYERAASRRARQRLALDKEAQEAVPLGRQAQAQAHQPQAQSIDSSRKNKHESVWERQAGQVVDASFIPQKKKTSQKAMDWSEHEDFLESRRRLRLLNISKQALKMKQIPLSTSAATAAAAAAATRTTSECPRHRPTDFSKQPQNSRSNYTAVAAAVAAVPPQPQKQPPPHRAAVGRAVVPARRRMTFSARGAVEEEATRINSSYDNNEPVRRGRREG